MKFGAYFIVFSILIAVGYGVAFSHAYPLVPIDGSLVSLSALMALATCLLIVGLWNPIQKIAHSIRVGFAYLVRAGFAELIGQHVVKAECTKLFNDVDLPSQTGGVAQPISLFFSYSHRDEAFRDELESHLKLLERQAIISGWHDREILPGRKWDQEIDHNLETAKVILLLVSADFIASEYCWGRELSVALHRHELGEATVVPIILRSCDWRSAPFSKLQGLPKEMKPVTLWRDRDAAWTNVALGIRAIAERISKERSA